jgi:hypothetical protein
MTGKTDFQEAIVIVMNIEETTIDVSEMLTGIKTTTHVVGVMMASVMSGWLHAALKEIGTCELRSAAIIGNHLVIATSALLGGIENLVAMVMNSRTVKIDGSGNERRKRSQHGWKHMYRRATLVS